MAKGQEAAIKNKDKTAAWTTIICKQENTLVTLMHRVSRSKGLNMVRVLSSQSTIRSLYRFSGASSGA